MENRTREYETHDSKLTLTTALCILEILNKQIPRAEEPYLMTKVISKPL